MAVFDFVPGDARIKEAIAAVREHGSQVKAAAALGIARGTLQVRLRAAEKWNEADPALRNAAEVVGSGMIPSVAWIKTKAGADGVSYSVQLRPKPEEVPDMIERVTTAFENISAAKPVPPPAQVMADLLTVYPLFDAHVGMHAWGKETGDQDYDLVLAASDAEAAFAKVMALTPGSCEAILLVGGDYFHQDDTRSETPGNHHKLDVDGRHSKVLDVGINILATAIERLLGKHQTLTVRVLRGNHDTHSHLVLTFAIAERYRNEPRVTVEKDPRDLFMRQWGRCAIFAHHGDKGKPQQMALYLSDVCAFWSATRHRHFLTGHVHHDQAKDFGPLRWESLRAFCPPDAYAAGMGYGARRAMQSMTFDKQDGLVLRAIDPIERAV